MSLVTWMPPTATASTWMSRPPAKDADRRRSAAEIDDGRAELGLVVDQRRQPRRIGRRDHRLDAQMAALDHQHEVAAAAAESHEAT